MLLKPNGPISVSRQKISTAEGTGDLASSSVDDARAQAWRDRPFRCHGDLDDAKPMATMRQTVHSWRIARLKIPRAGKNEDEQEMGDNSMDCAAVELRYARRPRLVFTGLRERQTTRISTTWKLSSGSETIRHQGTHPITILLRTSGSGCGLAAASSSGMKALSWTASAFAESRTCRGRTYVHAA